MNCFIDCNIKHRSSLSVDATMPLPRPRLRTVSNVSVQVCVADNTRFGYPPVIQKDEREGKVNDKVDGSFLEARQ